MKRGLRIFVLSALVLLSFSVPGHAAAVNCGMKLKEVVKKYLPGVVHAVTPAKVWTELMPVIADVSRRKQPQIENDIALFEQKVIQLFKDRGGRLPSFALRGVGVSSLRTTASSKGSKAFTLGDLHNSGFLSEDGGNFFLVIPEKWFDAGVDEFMGRLYSSVAAAAKYAKRESHPIVLVVKVDKAFPLTPSGGNDGISGEFPHTLYVKGRNFLSRNADVACVTRPHASRKKGLVRDRVPEDHVLAEVGAVRPPDFIYSPDPWSKSENELIWGDRWVYHEVLREILSLWDGA